MSGPGQLAAALGGAAAAALVPPLLLAVLALRSASRAGPPLPPAVLRRYRGEIARAVARQLALTTALAGWLALAGLAPWLGLAATGALPAGFAGGLAAGLLGIGLGTAAQLARVLLHNPATLVMCWPFGLERLNALHRHLTLRRLRWAELVLALAWAAPVVAGVRALGAQGARAAAAALAAGALLAALPVLAGGGAALARAWRRGRSCAPPPHPAGPGEGPMNVLMIGCDTLRADHVGMPIGGGRSLTPFLDALARRGTLFATAWTPVARTAPSLASLLTGTWPRRHGIRDNFEAPRPLPVPALPAILREAGYATEAVADWAGSDLGKFPFGFARADVPPDQWNLRYLVRQGPKETRLPLALFLRNRLGRRIAPEIHFLGGAPLNRAVTDAAVAALRRLGRGGRPFLLNVFAATAHPPFGSEWPHYRWFADPAYDGPSRLAMARLTDPDEIIRAQQEPREAFDLDQVLALYRGCVRRFDDLAREIVQALWREGLGERTIVVVYSDHGMEFFEHGTWGQGNSAAPEASPRVPLLILDPRLEGRGRVEGLVRTIDLAPTLLDLLGMPAEGQGMDGVSLAPFLRGEAPLPELTGYFETGIWLAPPPNQHPGHLRYPKLTDLLTTGGPDGHALVVKPEYRRIVIEARDRAVRRGPWKLVRLALAGSPIERLYRIRPDGTPEPAAQPPPGVLDGLRHALSGHIEAQAGASRTAHGTTGAKG